jgi:hypothetical protein
MGDLELLRVELELERRSLAMLSPGSPITREKAIAMIERCQRLVDEARR